MSIKKAFTPAPEIRVRLNVGGLYDISTGRYYIGKRGESILNGGLQAINIIGGFGNSGKSLFDHSLMFVALNNYVKADGMLHDTELTVDINRVIEASMLLPGATGESYLDSDRFVYTNQAQEDCIANKWWPRIKDYLNSKIKAKDYLATPFIDSKNAVIKVLRPTILALDSLSEMQFDKSIETQDDAEIGDSARNTEFMQEGGFKTRLLREMSQIAPATNTYVIATVAIGLTQEMGRFPPPKLLDTLKNGVKFKNATNKLSTLSNSFLCSLKTEVETGSEKDVRYHYTPNSSFAGDTELKKVIYGDLRNKGGAVGPNLEFFYSQAEGMLYDLTNFNFFKEEDYGIEGNATTFRVSLKPDVVLNRKTVRTKLREDYRLRRACEIQAQLMYITKYWTTYPKDWLCTPKELYDDIKAMGYDWDELLNTRGHWIFEEDTHPLNYLSTECLLRIRKGLYVPYWKK